MTPKHDCITYLLSKGWKMKQHACKGTTAFSNPIAPGEIISIRDDGAWAHSFSSIDEFQQLASGMGYQSLRIHLNKLDNMLST